MQKLQYKIHNVLESSHWWFLGKREYITSYLPRANYKQRIFDLGCGVGGTSMFLEKWGIVDRIEISPHAIPFLKKKGIKFKRGNIEKVDFGKNKYDLICLLDVLYHKKIKNINKIFLKSNVALKKNGLMLITDSALPFLYSLHDKKMAAGQRFYLSFLSSKVKLANFKIVKKSYTYFFLFPFFALSRLINKFINFTTFKKTNRFINKLCYEICRLEAYLLRYISFPIGSSIIILAQKQ